MEQEILSAISVASDPRQDRGLQAQALEYLNQVRSNPLETWRVALSLFLDVRPDGARSHDPQTRIFALQVLDDLLDSRFATLDEESFLTLEQAFTTYIHSEYIIGSAESNAPFIRNKFSHTMALLFLCTYPTQWPSFFTHLFSLLRAASSSVSASTTPILNPHVSTLFLHLLLEISGEVADQTLKAARTFDAARHARDAAVRDELRARDAPAVSEAVLAILADGEIRLVELRKNPSPSPEKSQLEDLVGLAMKSFASIVPWIDINLSVTPQTLPLLFRLLADPASPIRLATSQALLKILQKGLKEPLDKLQLIRVLSIGDVLSVLEERTRIRPGDSRSEDDIDQDVQYREALGKLGGGLGLELIKLLEEPTLQPDARANAEELFTQLLPIILRFLADEYDDTSMSVFTVLTSIFSLYKKAKKIGPQTHLTEGKRQFLRSALEIVIAKLKWDKEADPDDMDVDDLTAFDNMRKELRSFAESILILDEELAVSALQSSAINILSAYERRDAIEWQDLELAVHLVFLFGELQRPGRDKGRPAFCQIPADLRESKVKLKSSDYAHFPLTAHGEMMVALIRSGASSYPHPTVSMQFFETISRYGDFFKVRPECVGPVLTALIDARGIHNPNTRNRGRLFYLFHRFIKDVKSEVSLQDVPPLLNSIGDLLLIHVELPELESPEQDVLQVAVEQPTLFDSQLYLFETVGTLISLLSADQAAQTSLLQAITTPLLNELSQTVQAAAQQTNDPLLIIKAHHLIRALGNIPKGFPDAPATRPPVPPPWIAVFQEVAKAILVSLGALSRFKIVREATRFAFARIIAAAGAETAQFIPTLMTQLLSQFETSELVEFLAFIGLIVHKLQNDVSDVLDELVQPLHSHIAALLAEPIDGTDAKRAHTETKKAYLEFLTGVMGTSLFPVLVSKRNQGKFVSLLESVVSVACDPSDSPCQKVAFHLLARLTTHFGAIAQPSSVSNVTDATPHITVPGYEQYIYEKLIPMAFEVPAMPTFNIKDGQALGVIGEIGVMVKATHQARGQEALDFIGNVFLPSKNCPPETAADFVSKLGTLDTKGFKKYWIDFVRATSTPQT